MSTLNAMFKPKAVSYLALVTSCAVILTVAALPVLGQPGTQPGTQPEQPPAQPKIEGANLRWNFSEGMKLTFMAETKHQAISSIRGTTEGAVLRLIHAVANEGEEISKKAAELLKEGGKDVLGVIKEYLTREASAKERKALKDVVEYLEAHPEGNKKMPDLFIIAEREGVTTCAIDWNVEKRSGAKATVWVKSHDINVRARQKTLGQENYESAVFEQGKTTGVDPTGKVVPLQEPESPVAALFFHSMSMDYRFWIDLNKRDVYDFKYTKENEEAERKQMQLKDPLQIGPSFRRLPGEKKIGDKWEIQFDYFAGGDGTRIHICEYELKSVEDIGGRLCARMPWVEKIYMKGQRQAPPGDQVGGGKGEFWMDVNENVLVKHETEIAFRTGTKLEIPRKENPNEKREMETFFDNVLNLRMRLFKVEYTKDKPGDNK